MLILVSNLPAQQMDCSSCHLEPVDWPLSKPAGIFQKAVGPMDKGQLQNNTSNFGNLASFHVWFSNAGHWPRTADENRQYAFGLGLMLAIDENNVIETETQTGSRITDWLPPDNALGVEYSGDVRALSDDTPFQASSDLPLSWPMGAWPGYYRVDITNVPDSVLAEHPSNLELPEARNQFSSDRDLFASFNDSYNESGSRGITVEQTSYSYGRPYAEDIIFWDLKIWNDGGEDLNDIHVGFYAKFRPDYDNHDYLKFIDSDGDGSRDLIYVYDLNNQSDGAWTNSDDPLGMVGLRIYDTPGQMGITDFHHFARAASPSTDQEMYALMTSDRDSDALVNPAFYFHGDDPRIDYTGDDSLEHYYPLWSEDEHLEERLGNAINYVISCGPFDLPADSMVTLSLAMIMGDAGLIPDNPDTADLMANVAVANRMYELYFQGAAPPATPTVHAVAGDEKVTLYWNGNSAEDSEDPWSQEVDFEGYKVYRSTDRGESWGDPVTDMNGVVVGYVPIAIFDLTAEEDLERFGEEVSGLDPLFNQNLGSNVGIVHTFTDSNLVNGVEYWYCVTAYDRGDPDDLIPSLQNALGASAFEPHTVSVTPGRMANDLEFSYLEPIGGNCEGLVRLEVEDPDLLKDNDYRISFNMETPYVDEVGDTLLGKGMTLENLTTGEIVLENILIGAETDTNVVTADGFLLYIEDAPGGVREMGWTQVAGDTCTHDWRVQSKWPSLVPTGQAIGETIETFDDWRITVDYETGVEAKWLDAFFGEERDITTHLPIRVEVITDPDNPIDVSESTYLAEFNHSLTDPGIRSMFYSPLGWDLEPGGLGYLQASPGWYDLHVDFLILEKIDTDPVSGDTIPNYMYLFTNHKPDTSINRYFETEIIDARAPSQGDQFTIITYKGFRPEISYEFSPLKKVQEENEEYDPLAGVKVVPDPYIVANEWETNEFGKRLMFNNLPSECSIRIYTLPGEHIATVDHNSPEGYTFWDMRTRNDQFIAPGVYLYHVKTPAGNEKLGRFLVIK